MISWGDEILYEKKQLGLETQGSLLQTAWFNIMLHFSKRGLENMREITPDDIQIHKSSSGVEHIKLVERATKSTYGALIVARMNWSCSCYVRDAWQPSLSCVSCEDLLVEAKQAMSSSLAETKQSQSDKIQLCKRCLVLQCTAWKTWVGEPSLWDVQKSRIGYHLHFTLLASHLWRSWRHQDLRMPEWSWWPAIRAT